VFIFIVNLYEGNKKYAYENRLDPGQPLSNLAAGLESSLFATQSIIPHQKQADFQCIAQQMTLNPFSPKATIWRQQKPYLSA